MPTAFVTGGTGFVGFNLILQLLADNWEIVALHRPTSNLKNLSGSTFWIRFVRQNYGLIV